MQIAALTSPRTVSGYGPAGRAAPVAPVGAAQQANPDDSWNFAAQGLDAATVREARRDQEETVYGADARLKQSGGPADENRMSAGDRELLARLRARDAKVRGHEAAHILAAGGQAAGPAQYDYQTGPDGRRYAIGGSVNISVVSSPLGDEDTARQAETARRAAMVNGEMSAADMQAAMRATEISARARNRAFAAYARTAFERE